MVTTELAERVRTALEAADLADYEDLLDPDVFWGAPDDDAKQWGCRNRVDMLAWWQRARDAGVRATVTEVVVGEDALLVGLCVIGRDGDADGDEPAAEPGEANRWQVMQVRDGRIVDVRGYEARAEAAARAGVASA